MISFRFVSSLVLVASVFAVTSMAGAQNLGTPRVRRDIHGNVLMTGNVAVTCDPASNTSGGFTCAQAQSNRAANRSDNNYNGIYVDADNGAGVTGSGTTTMSSSASLSLPATGAVRWAGLYWMCETSTAALTAARGNVSFQGPAGGGYTALTADTVMTGAANGGYLSFKDVTSRVTTSGTYWVGNMSCDTAGTNHWGGWSLVVIYEDATEPLRDLVVWDGSQSYQNTPVTLNLTGFVTPFSPLVNRVTDVGMFLGDGDLAATDSLTLTSGALVTVIADPVSASTTDLANSTIATPYLPVQTRTPSYNNTLGLDIDVVRLTNRLPTGAQTASISGVGSAGEIVAVGAITFSTNIYAPDLVATKTAVDVNGGQLLPGDILEYTIHVVNSGLDAALNTQLVDDLPAFTTLAPGADAIKLDGVNLTRAADGDSGAYAMALNRVTVGIGTGPTGRVDTGVAHDIVIRVQLAAGIANGTVLSNQAQFVYNGETLGNAVSYNSLSDGSAAAGSNPTTTPIVSPASLTFTETAALTTDVDLQGDLDPGDTVTYTITATNAVGAVSATTVHLTDVLDTSRLEFLSVTTSLGTVASMNPASLDVNVGTLAGGQSVVVTLVARIKRAFPVGVTTISDQWSATGSFGASIVSNDPGTPAANDATVIGPITGSCACFVGNVCFASGAADPANSCQSCQPATSQTAFTAVTDGNACGVGGSCHAGVCCATCWNGAACVAGPTTCGLVCGDGQRIAGEECDDGNGANGDGCSSACGVEGGFSCAGALPNTCVANVTITSPASGSSTSDTTPPLTGTGPANAMLTVTEGVTVLCTTTVSAGGTWSCTSSTLALGMHTVVAHTSGPGAGDLGLSVPRSFTVIPTCGDSTVGAGETCDDGNGANGDGCSSACEVEAGFSCVGTGPSTCSSGVIAISAPANGSQTTDPTPDVIGTALANSTVEIYEGATLLCTTTANGAGAFMCTSASLSLGAHTIFARSSGPGAADHGLSTNDTFTVVASASCGNGTVGAGETCDDGNTTNGDGCASNCAVEAGYSCVGAGPSVCTTGVIAITAPVDGSETSDSTPDIAGTARPLSTVTVFEAGTQLCTATANAAGAWTCTSSVLALGAHMVFARSAGPDAGDHGLSTVDTFTVVASSAQVGPTILSPPDGGTVVNPTPTIIGRGEAGASISVLEGAVVVCTSTVDPSGAWSCVPSAAFANGAHTIVARQTKAGSTLDSTPTTFTLDPGSFPTPALVAPAPGSTTADSTPTLSGTAAPGSTLTVTENGAVICVATTSASGVWTCTATTPLAEGPHVFDLRSVLGTRSAIGGPDTIIVDLTAPTIDVTGPAPGSSVADSTPAISGTSEPGAKVDVYEGATLLCSTTVDASGFWACSPGTPLGEGLHVVRATATDPAGNVSAPDATNFVVDTTGPAAPVIVAPSEGAVIGNQSPTIAGSSEPLATIVVTEGAVTLCTAVASATGAWSCVPTTPLATGAHAIVATASDALGNVGGNDTQAFTITLGALSTPSLTGPLTPVSDTTPDLTGLADPGATVTVRDSNGTLVCSGVANGAGVWTCTPTAPLLEGPNALTLVATLGPATSTPGSGTVVIDTAPPAPPTITEPGSTPTPNPQPVIGGTAEPFSTVTVKDGGGTVLCTAETDAAGHWACVPTTPLPEGSTPITATATDDAGNESGEATATIVVDTTAPVVTITFPADGSTIDDTTPTVTGTTEPNAHVVVTDSAGFVVCTATAGASGAWSCDVPSALVDGPHTLFATATDGAGNTSRAAQTTFVVDTSTEAELGSLSGGALCAVTPTTMDRSVVALVLLALGALTVRRRRAITTRRGR